jgi:hypothetical protein
MDTELAIIVLVYISDVAVVVLAASVVVLAASVVVLATSEVTVAVVASGSATVTPLAAQRSETLEITSASSAGVQASLIQGVTAAKSDSAFWQWHAESSIFWQPSLVKGAKKQFNCIVV